MGGKRGHNEGGIYKLAEDERWVGSLSLGYAGGKRKRRYVYGQTRREVQEKLTALRRAHDDGLPVAPEKQTLGAYLQQWVEHSACPTIRPTTYASYAQLIRLYLVSDLGHIPLVKLTPPDVQAWVNKRLAGGLSPRTVQYAHAVLRRALGQAQKWGMVPRNVATLVSAPRIRRPEAKFLAPEQVRVFLESVHGDRLEGLFTVSMLLGLRPGEALGLHWRDVDLQAGTLAVRVALHRVEGRKQIDELKTDRSRRSIPLPGVAIAALRAHRARQLEERLAAGDLWEEYGLVFTNATGKPMAEEVVARAFHRALRQAGLPDMRFYDLRHTCASLLHAQGVHMRVVMEILGHSQIAMTMNTYSHVTAQLERHAADQMDALFARGGG
jgi:integrase